MFNPSKINSFIWELLVMSNSTQTTQKGKVQEDLRLELIGRFSREKFGLKNRAVTVTARMSSYIVEILDALVELEIFNSRSDAVSALLEKLILSDKTIFDELRSQAQQIKTKRESTKHLAFQTLQSKAEK